jgi:predicted amidohydrolase
MLRVAAVQHDIVWEDRDANLAAHARRVDKAAAEGAGLVLFTETFAVGFSMATDRTAEPADGPTTAWLVEQAGNHDVWVGGSVPIRADGAHRPRNAFVLAGPGGQVHRYDKRHPFSFGREDEHFEAGDTSVTVDLGGVRSSPAVCYDLRFADQFWSQADGTDLYVVVANWPSPRQHHWRALLVARAIENQAYVVGVNRVGTGGGLEYTGDSRIVDPAGELLATAAHTESILLADVSAGHVADVRDHFRFLPDRRTG